MGESKRLCVFCGSSSGADPIYLRTAEELGTTIGSAGHHLIYGGGKVGLMRAVADSALAAGGKVTGVMTEQLVALEVAHTGLTTLEVQRSMHGRKARMADLADGVIVLPGGFGTIEEAFELLTWNQLGIVSIPIAFLDVMGFFDPLFDFIDGSVKAGFMKEYHGSLVQRARDAARALEIACGRAPVYEPKWVD
jgi:uncharacterized protein (TIGR00730 family)